MSNFSDIINLAKNTIQNLVGFSQSLIPILITLMMTTGSIASASVVQPILLFLITFIGNIITTFLLPLILIGTALGIVSKVSDKVQINKLSKYFKSSTVWILGIVLTLFVGVLSLEGSLTSSVDGVTAKTAKAAVSNFIPVVGKILGDAVDTVIGCSNILKNAVGIVGALVIGESAVSAGIIGSPTLMVVAIAAIASYTIPDLYPCITILRLVYIICGGILGLWGIVLVSFVMLLNLCGKNSFGVPYASPFAPFMPWAMRDTFIRASWKKLAKKVLKIQDVKGADEEQ